MSYWRLYYHFVWATKGRQPMIHADLEHSLYSHIGRRAQSEGALVYAIGGIEDHVHLIAALPPSQSISVFMQRVKGSSSHYINSIYHNSFEWQEGYGAFSVSPGRVDAGIAYVEGQKEHHRSGTEVKSVEQISQHNEGPRRPQIVFE